MYQSEVMIKNSENLKLALTEGISNEAIKAILRDILENCERKNLTPEQLKVIVEILVEMQGRKLTRNDVIANSKFMQDKFLELDSVIKMGIEAQNVRDYLTKEEDARKLSFATRVVGKAKQKEKVNTNTKGYNYQKVKLKEQGNYH